MKWTRLLGLLALALLAACNLPSTPAATPGAGAPTAPAGLTPAALTPAPGAEVTLLTRDETNARTGPGLAFPASHLLPAGLTVRALGRSADNAWLVISAPPEDLDLPALWVAADVVDVRGDLNRLPVVAGPAPPTPGPTRPSATARP